MPLEVVVELQIRAVFENAIDPGAVVDLLEMWDELAYYEENTRDFLFPEPKLTPSHPGMCREVLMKTAIGFPEERYKSQKPLFTSHGPVYPLNNKKMKPKENHFNRMPKGMQSPVSSPYTTRRLFQDQPAQLNVGNNFRISGESKPPFVVRHVDSAKPFGESVSEHHSRKSKRKSKFSDFPFPLRRASSLDSLAANVKVIKEPDERIVLRRESPSPLDSSKFGKLLPSNRGDANFHQETSLATLQHSRSLSPLDQPFLQERSVQAYLLVEHIVVWK
ncbi:hypothetical protein TREES_T100010017 [Tupaia chinensis]|uniref:Spermatogenesis-associated protein 6 N-terminal domain-containing protein n=1 Tax=Tupaia chinensis TaxID=246437 RepID=L9KK20_TUPCH|nr:hypothetical protein TREES_T100010017 [Tupaia chinensis]